jgi:hypothetical protein
MMRLRRYESGMLGGRICTHEGLYDPETVNAVNLGSYHHNGPAQDRVAQPPRPAAAVRNPA